MCPLLLQSRKCFRHCPYVQFLNSHALGTADSLPSNVASVAMTDQGETQMRATASATVESRAILGGADPEKLFQLGMMYASGRSVPTDMVSAHKWLNIAALRGNAEAARLRREIAEEMSDPEIAAAQRAARDWIARH
jgi:uncharacterized protein